MEWRANIAGQLLVGLSGLHVDRSIERVLEYGLGGVVLSRRNVCSRAQVVDLIGRLREGAGAGEGRRPLLIVADHEPGTSRALAGVGAEWPPSLAIGRVGDPGLARQVGRHVALEMASLGVDAILWPLLDRHPEGAPGALDMRVLASAPEEVGELAVALIQGLMEGGLLPLARHFPGIGPAPDYSQLKAPAIELDRPALDTELIPFRTAIAAGLPGMVMANASYPRIGRGQLPASLDPSIYDLLQRELGFDGLVLTDDLSSREMWSSRTHLAQIVRKALVAGAHMVQLGFPGRHLDLLLASLARHAEEDTQLQAGWRRAMGALDLFRSRLETARAGAEGSVDSNAAGDLARRLAMGALLLRPGKAPLPLVPDRDSWLPVIVGQPAGGDDRGGSIGWFAEFAFALHPKLRIVNLGTSAQDYERALAAAAGSRQLIIVTNSAHSALLRLCRDLLELVDQLYLLWCGHPSAVEAFPEEVTCLCSVGSTRASLWAAATRLFRGEVTS